MVAHLVKPLMNIDITKPQLFYWQMFLFSEQTTFPRRLRSFLSQSQRSPLFAHAPFILHAHLSLSGAAPSPNKPYS